MTKRKNSEFRKWFEAQAGKRPSKKPLNELIEKLNLISIEKQIVIMEYESAKFWDEAFNLALLAWNARERQ